MILRLPAAALALWLAAPSVLAAPVPWDPATAAAFEQESAWVPVSAPASPRPRLDRRPAAGTACCHPSPRSGPPPAAAALATVALALGLGSLARRERG